MSQSQDKGAALLAGLNPGPDQQLIGLGIALCLGLLVGLERESSHDKPLGLRSFGITALLGGLAALFLPAFGGWIVAAALIGLCLLLGFWIRREDLDGLTTIMAAPVVFLIGAAAVAGHWIPAIVVAGAVTLLLHWKQRLHRLVSRLGDGDLEIIARFVLLTLVVLPVLPDQSYGPYDVFNPFRTWLLVVLIVGINLAGYVAIRIFGTGAGGWLSGVLGGLVSSTATTISYAGMSRNHSHLGPLAALVVLVASVIVYPRMLLEVSVVSPALVPALLWPSLLFSAVLLGLALLIQLRSSRLAEADLPERENPAGIKVAISFGVLYVVLLCSVSWARDQLGEQALYGVSVISGLMDVDALTLSIGQLHADGGVSEDTAWRAIFLASLSNLLFKVGAACALGAASLRRWLLGTGSAALVAGSAILLLWP